jgi:protein ImuB
MFSALLAPGADDRSAALAAIACDFSPRYEAHGHAAVVIDVCGLDRLIGEPRAIGEALVREATARGLQTHVAVAGTWTAALVLAHARPGLTVVAPGDEASALAPLSIQMLQFVMRAEVGPREKGSSACGHARPQRVVERCGPGHQRAGVGPREKGREAGGSLEFPPLLTFQHWGLRTLGELAALPDAELVARFGRPARAWQAMARGADERPLVPALEAERFEGTLELEWPIEGQEPLSFVLTRLLEPLSTRLERRDRGAAVLHVRLRLVTRLPGAPADVHARRLELPTPIRDVRTLRTLALLDLESHPPDAAIDAVTVFIEPTPARVLQHGLFVRARPQPEQMATLVARLNALMGQDRVGTPVAVDSYRPGAFEMAPFTEPMASSPGSGLSAPGAPSAVPLAAALRRWRRPIAARVVVEQGRPARVTTDRRAIAGGAVLYASGPWRTSGAWWASGESDNVGAAGARGGSPTRSWNRDEWEVALADGASYRLFEDRETGRWFIEAVLD